MRKLFLIILLELTVIASHAQNVKGLYVNGFNSIVGNQSREDSLLRFAENNGFNYLTLYEVHLVHNANPLTNVSSSQTFANFISKAKTQFGINQIGVAAENYWFFSNVISVYNQQHTSWSEKVDVYNFEFEFWIPTSVEAGAYYCSTYLQPNSFSCDTAGAFQFYKKNLHQIDSLANANGQLSEAYFGFFNAGQGNQIVQTGIDRVLLSIYLPTSNYSASYQYNYVKPRLQNLASSQIEIKVLPIYSAESTFMQSWVVSNPFFEPFSTLSTSLQAETASWKNYINLEGIQWFAYSFMPKKNLDLSVNENQTQKKSNCKVFPNPSTDYFQIKLEDTQNEAQFCLFDLSGKLIAKQDFKQEIIVSTSQFPAGLYFLKVKSNDSESNLKLTVR
jgi:hypothetical protein